MDIRKSNTEWKLTEEEFKKRYRNNFYDSYFDSHRDQIEQFADIAWKAYLEGRKAPHTKKAGKKFADPHYDLSLEWLAAKDAIDKAQAEHEKKHGPHRILLINASHRNDHTCPGEISKSSRLYQKALETLETSGAHVEKLELNQMSSEYSKRIFPCKACVSTAMPLCHWPCSCYPNHALNQVNDWMNDIYPMWVRAHGIMIITPVYWHQSPSALKLMIDRLVCADGGNPDPTTTQGKKVELAKKIELDGWNYPRHLKGRVFSVVVHGDAMGVDDSKNTLCDWLEEMELTPTGTFGKIGRYVGYFKPYATSHQDLDHDENIFQEVVNAAKALLSSVQANRENRLHFSPELEDPRPK